MTTVPRHPIYVEWAQKTYIGTEGAVDHDARECGHRSTCVFIEQPEYYSGCSVAPKTTPDV